LVDPKYRSAANTVRWTPSGGGSTRRALDCEISVGNDKPCCVSVMEFRRMQLTSPPLIVADAGAAYHLVSAAGRAIEVNG